MDSGFNVAVMVLAVALVVSIAFFAVAGFIALRLLRRVWRRLEELVSNHRPTGISKESPTGVQQTPARNGAWWLWPLTGLVLGTLAALWGRVARTESQAPSPEQAEERLLNVYNPLLMLVNGLSVGESETDAKQLAQEYQDNVRPLLYANSHLLSQALLRAAGNADRYLDGDHAPELARSLQALQAQVRADHRRLQKQSETQHAESTQVGA